MHTTESGLLNERQAAKKLGLSVAAMRNFRQRGGGPRFAKIGSACRYDPVDLQAVLAMERRSRTGRSTRPKLDEDPVALLWTLRDRVILAGALVVGRRVRVFAPCIRIISRSVGGQVCVPTGLGARVVIRLAVDRDGIGPVRDRDRLFHGIG